MGELGISIYPSKSSLSEMKHYIAQAAEIGYQRIFTSMLEVAENPTETIEKFKEVIAYGNQLGMKTSLDVNPRLFSKLGISYQNLQFFSDLGVWSIRLDEGFTGLEEARMSMNPFGIVIELNISRGQHYIDMVMDFGADKNRVIGSHNFYPQAYTGLDFDYFVQTARQYKSHHLRTAAFVDSSNGLVGPWLISDLMVSTEMQRRLSITAQVQLLKMTNAIDDIIVSSSLVPREELMAVYRAFYSSVPMLSIRLDKEVTETEKRVIFEPLHMYRGDYSGYMIRSSETRVTYKESDFPVRTTENLKKGDITICNNAAGQYKGELQIVLKDRPNDGHYNLVGKITLDSLPILDLLKPWQSFRLQMTDEGL